jgi:surfactin synthase thioesterase subunit
LRHNPDKKIAFIEGARLVRHIRKIHAVAACTPPHLPGSSPSLHALPDDALVAELSRYENIPAEVLAHEELRALILPRIRADFEMLETFRTEPVALTCPLMILAASGDPMVDVTDAMSWQLYSSAASEFHALAGGHSFVQMQRTDIVQLLTRFMIHQLDGTDL